MVSSFYSSNEQKQKKYIKSRRIEEFNEEKQQQVVDDSINKELGLETEASDLGKLATRVINKIGTEIIPKSFNQNLTKFQYTPLQLLTNSIEKGTLTNLFDKIKALPNSSLNKKQRIMRDDLNKPEFKSIMNESIADSASSGTNAIIKTVIETMSGSESDTDVLDMVKKASTPEISEFGYSTALGREKKKRGPKPKK